MVLARRIQELRQAGWTWDEIEGELGKDAGQLRRIFRKRITVVRAKTAERPRHLKRGR
jgi:hypothetical protein